MARPLRLEYIGALYHVTSRGDRRDNIYIDDGDREQMLLLLGEVCERFNWVVHSYCLMSNHYHLLIETPDGNLSKGMRQLNGVYTQRFNRKHGRVGHLFQGRYKAIIVQKDSYLLELSRYIVLNPVRARMVSRAGDWPWSSYRATVGRCPKQSWLMIDWILSGFGGRSSQATQTYETYVSAGLEGASPWEQLKSQIYLGSDQFVAQTQSLLSPERDLSEIPLAQRRTAVKSLSEYADESTSRNMAIYEAYSSGGYSMKEVGDYFGLHYSRVSRILKGMKAKGKI